MTFYESKRSLHHVTLCLYYRMHKNQCKLTTPWESRVECDVAWYNMNSKQSEPVFISTGVYRDSKLITQTFNTVEIDLPAPPPGEYRVVVQQHVDTGTFTISGICHIHKSGFVTFNPIAGDRIPLADSRQAIK